MDIPSLFMIPSAVSSGKVHSVFPNSTDADFDFNRDSDATRVNSEGLIERVGYYGSELITNGDFSSASDWTITNNTGTATEIINGYVRIKTDGAYTQVEQTSVTTAAKTYKLQYTVLESDGGDLGLLVTGNTTVSIPNTVGTHIYYFVAHSTSFIFKRRLGALDIKIDNVSVKEVTGDRARLNYEIEGGLVNTKPSLLLEPQSTNLVTYSEDFNQTYWAKSRLTVTPNAIISPTGDLNASLIQETSYTSSTNRIGLQNAISLSAGTYTLSFYVKNNKGRYLGISFGSSSERVRTNFDFNTNTFKALSLSGTTTGSASFTTLGDFYRLSVTATFPSTVPANITITPLATDTYPFFALQDSDNRSFYMWGVQLEQQSYATSYIPTNGSTQTRAAETCNGAGTSSIFESSEGILYAEIAALANDGTFRQLTISDSSTSDRVSIDFTSTNNQIRSFCSSGGGTVANMTGSVTDATQFNKVAVKYKLNDYALYINGSEVATDTSGAAPVGLQELAFDNGGGSNDFYGKIRDIRVYNTKEMTDSEVDILLTKITS